MTVVFEPKRSSCHSPESSFTFLRDINLTHTAKTNFFVTTLKWLASALVSIEIIRYDQILRFALNVHLLTVFFFLYSKDHSLLNV